MSYRAVDLALEAEPAATPAALAHLEQLHVAVLGLGRLDDGARLEGIDIPQPALDDHRGRLGLPRIHRLDATVIRVAHVVGIRHVDAAQGPERLEEAPPRVGRAAHAARAPRLDDLADDLFAFPHHDHVHERRHRFRIREGADAPHHHDGIAGTTVRRPRREPRHAEEPHGVDVVALVGHGEADQVEIGERTLRLQREGSGSGPPVLVDVFRVGKEHALAEHLGQSVQMLVDGLKAQVRHADGVRIGIDEGDAHPSAPFFAHDTFFAGNEGLRFLLESPGHAARTPGAARGGAPGTWMSGCVPCVLTLTGNSLPRDRRGPGGRPDTTEPRHRHIAPSRAPAKGVKDNGQEREKEELARVLITSTSRPAQSRPCRERSESPRTETRPEVTPP